MITRFLRKRKARLWARWLRDSIDKALALSRYDVRRDGLSLMETSFRLKIAWRARHVHPWDRDLEEDKRASRLVIRPLPTLSQRWRNCSSLYPRLTLSTSRCWRRTKRRTAS